jgi:hypothetical protein
MIEDDRRRGARKEPDDTSDDDAAEEDVVCGIWASFSAPSIDERQGISVESIKERLKRGAARRRDELGDRDSG